MRVSIYGGANFSGMKIGLLGGSFNPAHEGHLAITLHAMKRLGLHQVWWIVSPQNPLKPTKGMAPMASRMADASLFLKGRARVVVCDIEAQLGTRYTIDTLRALRMRMPCAHFVWLMGADNFRQCVRWKKWDDLFRTTPIAVFRRPRYSMSRVAGQAASRFASAWVSLDEAKGFALRHAPAWLVLDNRFCPLSASALRAGLFTSSKKEHQRGC